MEKAGPKNNWYYNRNLQTYANKLRKDMTKAEACLWKYVLRAGKLSHWQFRRQRPVLNYIADFLCKELLLIIEVDGFSHDLEGAYEKDLARERALEEVGFEVIRFHNEDVLNDIDNVQRKLLEVIEKRQDELAIPPPSPRQRGKFLRNSKE